MMELREIIRKYRIYPFEQNGNTMLKVFGKPSQEDIKIIKTQKQEIIAECRKMTEEKEEKTKAEKEELKNQNVKVIWMEGTPLSGYMVVQNKELLMELGLAKEISGWGTLVDKDLVEALGEEFTADQAREYAKPAIEKVEEVKRVKEEQLKSAMESAKVLGHKVEVKRQIVDCDRSVPECNTDILILYIDGKGKYTEERIHTH